MKIGLIVHPYGEKDVAGLGRSIFQLAKNIIENDHSNEYCFFVKGSGKPLPEISGSNWRYIELPEHYFWLDIGLYFSPRQDLYIFFTPFLPIVWTPCRSLVVVHDFAYRHISVDSTRMKIIQKLLFLIHSWSLRRASKIIAISEYTKTELLKIFKIPFDRVRVIHNGFDRIIVPTKIHELFDRPYFLFVGVVKERKNILRLVRAYSSFVSLQDPNTVFPRLVIVGTCGGKYGKQVRKFVSDNALDTHVIFTGYVPDVRRAQWYAGAYAFIFPSLIEGFGLPILEAMSIGLPVITSNQGALAEIASDAAILVDPYSVESIAEGMARLWVSNGLHRELIARGKIRCEKFSWRKAANEYMDEINDMSV